MSELSTENWMAILLVTAFFVWAIATFLFSNITVKYLEREMVKEGICPPILDKGIGGRMIAYAGIITFPNLKRHASLVNIEATKRFSREKDKKLALLYTISTVSFLIIMFTVAYLYGPES
jgi:hypothetical protein